LVQVGRVFSANHVLPALTLASMMLILPGRRRSGFVISSDIRFVPFMVVCSSIYGLLESDVGNGVSS